MSDTLISNLREAKAVRNSGTPATTLYYCVDCDAVYSTSLEEYPDFEPERCAEHHNVLEESPEQTEISSWLNCLRFLDTHSE